MHCKKPGHFSYLCFSSKQSDSPIDTEKKKNKDVNNIDKSKVSNGTCSIEVNISSICDLSLNILPTFTCKLSTGKTIRVLKDSGAQVNFIKSETAIQNKLKIIKSDISITISGFNSQKKLKTNLVEIPIILNNESFILRAISVPNIATDIRVEGLYTLADQLKEKGYDLADECIISQRSDRICNLDVVLGTSSSYCLPFESVVFGNNPPSCLYNTSIGTLILGNVKDLINNLKYLPIKNDHCREKQYDSSQNNKNLLSIKMSDVSLISSQEDSSGEFGSTNPRVELNQPECDQTIKGTQAPVEDSLDCDGAGEQRLIDNFITSINMNNLMEEHYLEKILDDNIIKNFNLDNVCDLDGTCAQLLNFEDCSNELTCEMNKEIIKSTLSAIERDNDGRLIVPILWHESNSHHLGSNLELCRKILFSITKKLKGIPEGIKIYNEIFREQVEMGVIEPIESIDEFTKANPNASFIAHMPVIKLNRTTTKCRIVYLSNICEKSINSKNLTHNQTMMPGPTLNKKLLTSLLQLRFDKNIVTFDLAKAFLQLKLFENDTNKLCFLWYKNPEAGDFSIQAYKCKRLSFGLRCSPSLLMLGLYYILIHNVHPNDELMDLKKQIYDLFYMDNGAICANSSRELESQFSNLNGIFSEYGFDLQQFATNDTNLSQKIEKSDDSEPVKLLGMFWNTKNDTLSAPKLYLDNKANTKRKILSTIASNFDILQINGPILNRARIFMHELQCNPKLKWDEPLDAKSINLWKNISKQINETPINSINRFMGKRDSKFELVACVDASKQLYGAVVYIVDRDSGQVSFLCAKNRMITNNLKTKSIPSLELLAINFGVEVLNETANELSGPSAVIPINITDLHILTDSQVCMAWLYSFNNSYEKMNKRSIYVLNRLTSINNLCKNRPVRFAHIAGNENPADAITRCLSQKILTKSNYFSGPDLELLNDNDSDVSSIVIPNPNIDEIDKTLSSMQVFGQASSEPLVKASRFSNYTSYVKTYSYVIKFIEILKYKIALKNGVKGNLMSMEDINEKAHVEIIRRDQYKHFPEIVNYFTSKNKNLKDTPELINNLNIFRDKIGLLRVKAKLASIGKSNDDFPILLSKDSTIASSIVIQLHQKLKHAGKYNVLSELRKKFFISSCFSFVKKCLLKCTHCKRFNNRTIKLNQNSYRKFRINPSQIPYRNVFIDYLGPFEVTIKSQKQKIYILLFTCLFTRAINLKLCLDQSLKNFLRGFQLHVFDHGFPSLCLSDLGSQIVAGSEIITKHISDPYTKQYLEENQIKSVSFSHYPKGCEKLGGLVETCVKMVKRLIYGAIRNNLLNYSEFEYIICEANHLINRRPIAFKDALRDCSVKELVPSPITPEMLIKGYELVSINIIPDLAAKFTESDQDFETSQPKSIANTYEKLCSVRKKLISIYASEFIPGLIDQATDVKERYKKVKNISLRPGDLVLLKETFCKPSKYPLAIVREINNNDLGEVTDIVVMKGSTREEIKRHVSSIIPLLSFDADNNQNSVSDEHNKLDEHSAINNRAPKRAAAQRAQEFYKRLVKTNLI